MAWLGGWLEGWLESWLGGWLGEAWITCLARWDWQANGVPDPVLRGGAGDDDLGNPDYRAPPPPLARTHASHRIAPHRNANANTNTKHDFPASGVAKAPSPLASDNVPSSKKYVKANNDRTLKTIDWSVRNR